MRREVVKNSQPIMKLWRNFSEKNPGIAQFIMFFIMCNGVTILQMVLMPLFKEMLGRTVLVDTNFQLFQVGYTLNGSPYYVFDYAAGAIASGGGGGLAYFLAVELTMGIAQVINFIGQRNVTFKSRGNIWKAAFWYVLAYLVITIGAAALQGIYKIPVYNFCIDICGASIGTTIADGVTMLINSAISFWVFFPILKCIFKK